MTEEASNKRAGVELIAGEAAGFKKAKTDGLTEEYVTREVTLSKGTKEILKRDCPVRLIKNHDSVVINALFEQALPEAAIKTVCLSDAEAKLVNWMLDHKINPERHVRKLQMMFYEAINIHGKLMTDEDKTDVVTGIKVSVKQYIQSFKDDCDADAGSLPFDEPELVQIFYNIVLGAKYWFVSTDPSVINHFMTGSGSFCMSWLLWE